MGWGLKTFWIVFLVLLIAGVFSLMFVGVPSPSVDVVKEIPLDHLK